MERWVFIKGCEDYMVSDDGRVVSFAHKKPKMLKLCAIKSGYLMVQLGAGNHKYVHRLVAEAFIPNPYNLPEVDHINTDTKDNRVSNLRWVTKKVNMNNPVTLKKRYKHLYKGLPALDIARHKGISKDSFYGKLKRGRTIQEALKIFTETS